MDLSGRSVSTIKCNSYFLLKPSANSKYISIDEYYKKSTEKNKRFKFTHENLEKCRFKYREKQYRYNELCIINCNQMKLPLFYDSEAMRAELFGTITQEKGYCLRLLKTFDRYLGKARYETIKAATILDIDYLNSDTNVKPYSWQYFQRCYNAENAIYSYYSLYEIIILMIYICENQGCGKSFEAYSKESNSGRVRKCLQQEDTDLFKLVSDGTNGVRIHPDFAKITDWCNAFKHRGIIRFDGEFMENQVQSIFVPEANSGLKPYSSRKNEFVYIDLDKEIIPELFNYHQKIIKLAENVIKHCNIKGNEIETQEAAK